MYNDIGTVFAMNEITSFSRQWKTEIQISVMLMGESRVVDIPFLRSCSMRTPSLLILMVSLLFSGCPEESIQPNENPLTLSVESVSCTEAFLKVSLSSAEQERTVLLKRNDSTIATIFMQGVDSIIIDEHLLPAKNYSYTVQLSQWSASVQTKTMDTTSHQWIWTVNHFGVSQSLLYDVAIINDTLAYAVGEIYIMDTTGTFDDRAYNLLRWNGKNWSLHRVPSVGSVQYPPMETIWANSPTSIFLSWGGGVVYFDGAVFRDDLQMNALLSGSITKLYAPNENNIYAVGRAGTIVHYDGVKWRKIESGTTVSLNDVWGGDSEALGKDVVLVPASEKYVNTSKKIFIIKNKNKIDTIYWQMQDRRIHSVWFENTSALYTSGGGVFRSTRNGGWKEMSLPLIYTNRIRGNSENDLMVVGDYGFTAHYNGITWKVYEEVKLSSGNYESVAIKGNLAIAIGWQAGRGYIAVGKR